MTREQARILLDTYKNFPTTKLFSVKPFNYPIFHLLECYANGWRMEILNYGGYTEVDNIDFERMAISFLRSDVNPWFIVARNPNLTNTTVGFVLEDLYARYAGKCNPLKTSRTSWLFIPYEDTKDYVDYCDFPGKIGKNTKLYQIEIDLDTTNIVGKRDPKLPWHHLQQTIEWKPWTGRIDWNEVDHLQDPQRTETLRERFERVRTNANLPLNLPPNEVTG